MHTLQKQATLRFINLIAHKIVPLHPLTVVYPFPFFDEFSSFLSLAATTPHEFIIKFDVYVYL